MPKLQRIKRSNGSLVYSVNIPLEIIEELNWKKGALLSLEVNKLGNSQLIQIIKIEDEKEEEIDG